MERRPVASTAFNGDSNRYVSGSWHETPSTRGQRIEMFRRALLIVLFSGLAGILVNSASPRGIPLFGPVPLPEIEGVEQIGLAEAWSLFQTGQSVFVDARSGPEFAARSIPGALSLGADEFDEKVSSLLDLLPQDSILVVFCSGKGCESSREVAGFLRDAGFRHVKVFLGGWEEWTDSGYPTSRSSLTDPEGEFP